MHWRDESDKRRHLVTEGVAALPLQHVVVIRDGRDSESVERRRRHCLERMLFELDALRIGIATFESRGSADDKRDRDMLDALRARKIVSKDLRIAHTPGRKDALLWVPDVVCGAVTQQRTGDGSYLGIISTQVHVITVSAVGT